MNKLFKGELKKLFLKPLVYIMAIILCASLVASLLLFKPSNHSYSSKTNFPTGATIEQMQTSFLNKKNEIDTSINNLSTTIDAFVSNNSNNVLRLQNFKNASSKSISDLIAEYKTLLTKDVSFFGSSSEQLNQLNQKLNEMKQALQDLKTELINLTTTPILNIRLTQNQQKEVLEILDNAILETTMPTTGLSVDGHKAVNDLIQTNNYNGKLTALFAKIENVGFTSQQANNLKDKYLGTEFSKKQNALLTEMSKTDNKEIYSLLARKYVSNSNTVSKIIYLSIYQNTAKNINDGKLQNLYGLNSLTSQTELNAATTTKYQIDEQLAIYNYLWSSNTYDFDYSYASNSNTTTGGTTSAIDFCLYAIQLASFLIIIFCVILGATSISNEFTHGTMKMIAIKPISRSSIIISKVASTTFIGLIYLLFSAIASFGIGYFAFGYNATNILAVFNATNVFVVNPIVFYLISITSVFLKLFVYISLSIMLSTLFKNNIPSLIVAFVVFFAGAIISSVLPTASFISYLPLFNLDLLVYFGGCNAVETTNLINTLFTTTYLNNSSFWITISYVVGLPLIFNITSIITFNKKDIV